MAESALKLVAGLGNPGAEYARTRHNAGYWFVDELARRHGGAWKRVGAQQCELARVRIEGAELWLVKPITYMNRSGDALQAVSGFYRLQPAELLVVHDEIDLPPGAARLKFDGGHGGHNGVRDAIEKLGPQFWRLRLGVGHPGHKDQVIDSVLNRATADEQALIDAALERSLAVLPLWLREGSQKAMQQLHTRDDVSPADEAAN